MGFWDTIVRTKKSTRSTAIDQDVQMGMPAGIGNIATNIRVPVDVDMPFNTRIDASKRADSRQWTTSNTYNLHSYRDTPTATADIVIENINTGTGTAVGIRFLSDSGS